MTMKDVVSALGLNGIPELFMLSNEDIDRFKGKKAVIAIMAANRNHPEFKNAERYFNQLQEQDELVIVTEDHADGPLHERFDCRAQEFRFALVDKAGNTVIHGDRIPTLQAVRDHLRADRSAVPAH